MINNTKRFRIRNSAILASVIVFFPVFILYLSMLSREYSTANFGTDGGDLLAAILTDGVPHPSGYPTYLLIGKVFQFLPLDSPYFKGSLASALFSALAAGALVIITDVLLEESLQKRDRMIVSSINAIALGIAPLFWSQAVIVEVYALAFFFFACVLLWCIYLIHADLGESFDWRLTFLSMLVGFGFGNHLLLGLMLPAMAYTFGVGWRKNKESKKLIIYPGLMLLGALSVYLILPLRARAFPPINWGNPQDPRNLLWLISGRPYQGLAFSLPAAEILSRLAFFAGLLQAQFWFSGLALGFVGLMRLFSNTKHLRWILSWAVLAYSAFSIGYRTNDSIVYLVPVLMVFSILIGFGVAALKEEYFRDRKAFIPLLAIAFLLPLVVRLPRIYAETDPRRESSARQFAETCLASAPENAIILTQEDADTFPLWYYHFGLKERSDAQILATSLLQYGWYRETMQAVYPEISIPINHTEDWVLAFRDANPENPVCWSETPDEGSTRACRCTEH